MTTKERSRYPASAGSVSSGTMREEDLIPKFIEACDGLELDSSEMLAVSDIKSAMKGGESYYNTDDSLDDLYTLADILDDHAPKGHYFGAHEGDGTDYGWWPSPEMSEEEWNADDE